MPTRERALELIEVAKKLGAEGRLGDASGILQSLVADLKHAPELKDVKQSAYSGLLHILFAEGRLGRLSKAFRGAVSEFCASPPDADFDLLYLTGGLATGTAPLPLRRRDRFRSLLAEFAEVAAMDGSVAECGCFLGLSSFLLCSTIRRGKGAFDGTGYEIYDSFQGLSEPGAEDREETPELRGVERNMRKGMYAASLDRVRNSLSAFPRIAFRPGFIPVAFPADNPARYRFVHVDVDLYQPTLDSFRYFWPLMLPGGKFVCDDYNWPGAKRAVEEFCAEQGVAFRLTPFNQATFTKPV